MLLFENLEIVFLNSKDCQFQLVYAAPLLNEVNCWSKRIRVFIQLLVDLRFVLTSIVSVLGWLTLPFLSLLAWFSLILTV